MICLTIVLLQNYSYDLSVVQQFIKDVDSINNLSSSLGLLKTAAETLRKVRMEQTIDSAEYFIFKNQLFLEKEVLNIDELRNLLTYLRTILKRTNFEENQYYHEHFSLYEFELESEIYLVRGSLTAQIVKNIITASIRADKAEWLACFLKNYNKHFPKDQAKQLETYCLACIQFERKEYQTVLKHLKGWEFKNTFLNLSKRILTIKTYYELENIDLFEAQINNLKRMISYYKKNHKIGINHSTVYQGFSSSILSIYKIIKKETTKINELEQKIQSIHHNKLPEKKWLLQKLNEKR